MLMFVIKNLLMKRTESNSTNSKCFWKTLPFIIFKCKALSLMMSIDGESVRINTNHFYKQKSLQSYMFMKYVDNVWRRRRKKKKRVNGNHVWIMHGKITTQNVLVMMMIVRRTKMYMRREMLPLTTNLPLLLSPSSSTHSSTSTQFFSSSSSISYPFLHEHIILLSTKSHSCAEKMKNVYVVQVSAMYSIWARKKVSASLIIQTTVSIIEVAQVSKAYSINYLELFALTTLLWW